MKNIFSMQVLKSCLFSLTIISLLLYSAASSQNIPDSFVNKMNHAINDSAKGIILLEIGESIEQTTPEKSMAFYKQALALGEQIKNNRLIFSSFMDVGVCYINLNKMDSAIIYLERAIPVAWR